MLWTLSICVCFLFVCPPLSISYVIQWVFKELQVLSIIIYSNCFRFIIQCINNKFKTFFIISEFLSVNSFIRRSDICLVNLIASNRCWYYSIVNFNCRHSDPDLKWKTRKLIHLTRRPQTFRHPRSLNVPHFYPPLFLTPHSSGSSVLIRLLFGAWPKP